MYPSNEEELIDFFRLAQARLGWRILHLQSAFPDALVENPEGQQLRVEFEYDARNFQQHGHNPNDCDLIICWRNSWENASVPVFALDGVIPPDDPIWERFAIEQICRMVSRLKRWCEALISLPKTLSKEIRDAVSEFERLVVQRQHLRIVQRQHLRIALANILRPILEEREWLREELSRALLELAEMKGGVIFTGGKEGEPMRTFIIPLHEEWRECTCKRCGKKWRVSVAAAEQSEFCSVECNLAAILDEFVKEINEALLGGGTEGP